LTYYLKIGDSPAQPSFGAPSEDIGLMEQDTGLMEYRS